MLQEFNLILNRNNIAKSCENMIMRCDTNYDIWKLYYDNNYYITNYQPFRSYVTNEKILIYQSSL